MPPIQLSILNDSNATIGSMNDQLKTLEVSIYRVQMKFCLVFFCSSQLRTSIDKFGSIEGRAAAAKLTATKKKHWISIVLKTWILLLLRFASAHARHAENPVTEFPRAHCALGMESTASVVAGEPTNGRMRINNSKCVWLDEDFLEIV